MRLMNVTLLHRMNMVINYCHDCLDFDVVIGCIIVAVALFLHTIVDADDDLMMVVLTVAEHFAVSHVCHYSLFFFTEKKNQQKYSYSYCILCQMNKPLS